MLRVVLSNCSPQESSQLARQLVAEGHAACVNVIPGVRSFYRWQGQLCEDEEHTLLIKCRPERYPALKHRLRELHSYSTPEIIALQPEDALQDYVAWAQFPGALDEQE